MKKKINIAIIGVGNAAKSLVEGIAYYTKNPDDTTGLMHPTIGEYLVSDIEIVAAFDIDERKVGKTLDKAVLAEPNRTFKVTKPLESSVIVQRGPTYDSISNEMRNNFIFESKQPVTDVELVLRESNADVVVNMIPTGSDSATYAYAEAALKARCNFINCIPTLLARVDDWRNRFMKKNLVIFGDDIKSQCGATILNRILLEILKIRGIKIGKSIQINYGGNADHFNLQFRAAAKENTKLSALQNVIGENDVTPIVKMIYDQEMYGHKRAEISVEGNIFGRVPIDIQVVLEDEDSPNIAGVVVDAIRAAKLLQDRNLQEKASDLCSFLMKAPPLYYNEEEGAAIFDKILN